LVLTGEEISASAPMAQSVRFRISNEEVCVESFMPCRTLKDKYGTQNTEPQERLG
jgi:hypothetical protein